MTVLQQSKEQGFTSYEIHITLREDCLLKAARVFMIFEVLEKIGEVIKSVPAVEQLEEEQFDSSLYGDDYFKRVTRRYSKENNEGF